MVFENSRAFARKLDAADDLKAFRSCYLFPKHEGHPVVYFTGNSLGLQPAGAREALLQELDDWQHWGVEGHFHAKHPWYAYHEMFAPGAAQLVGAKEHEVVLMNQLTVNLQLLLVSFYRPSGKRRKILFEYRPFPSDRYAFESQARLHGLNPADVLVEMKPRNGELLLRHEDIEQQIEDLGEELALVCFGGVNYISGQLFDMQRIAAAAHHYGAICGFDLAHAAGNVPLQLHLWEVDFACWCTYKYLNSGPGSVGGAYIHERHTRNKDLPRLAGWWGHNKQTRFRMDDDFEPMLTAEAWQLSNAPVFNMAIHKVALDLFSEAGMGRLRSKSLMLTAYLEYVLKEVAHATMHHLQVITPADPAQRGCQLSVVVPGASHELVKQLHRKGVVVDWREPNVVRMAPVPMYNTFEDVYSFGQIFQQLLTA